MWKDEGIFIPDEIIVHIQSYLPTKDLINSTHVNKQWMEVSTDSFWEDPYLKSIKEQSIWLKHFKSLSTIHFIFKVIFQDQEENEAPERILITESKQFESILTEKINNSISLLNNFIILYTCLLFNILLAYFSFLVYFLIDSILDYIYQQNGFKYVLKNFLLFTFSYFNSWLIFSNDQMSNFQMFGILISFIFLISIGESIPYVIIDLKFRKFLTTNFYSTFNYSFCGHYVLLGIYFGLWGTNLVSEIVLLSFEILINIVINAVLGGNITGRISYEARRAIFSLGLIFGSYYVIKMISIYTDDRKYKTQIIGLYFISVGQNDETYGKFVNLLSCVKPLFCLCLHLKMSNTV
eukprot:gene12830-7181_t